MLKNNKEDIFLCKLCILPSSKPHIQFNKDGICTGYTAHNNRKNIDWISRQNLFLKIIEKYKK